ncbi:MAG: hypothetical protein R3241_05005 [Rheinheimera sp.]|nr:hypothetical protein [Rheinheimera sp.]
MIHRYLLLALILLVSCYSKPLSAALITTDIFYVSDDIWEYHYTIENDTALTIEQFALYFPSDTYQNLLDISTQPDWDILLVQPGALFPEDDGIFDALALVQGIAPGEILSGFAVRFSFIGDGDFGAQLFEVYDPISFETIDSGQTPAIAAPTQVAAPAVWGLLALGVLLLMLTTPYRHRSRC